MKRSLRLLRSLAPLAFALAASLAPASALASHAKAKAVSNGPREVQVAHAHVLFGDVVPTASEDVFGVDLGPAPQLGGTRMFEKDELLAALAERQMTAPENIPPVVRVSRKAQTLDLTMIDRMVREGLDAKLARGVSLVGVKLQKPLEVPAGFTRVEADMPRPPRRVGPLTSATTLTFYEGDQSIAMVSVPVDLILNHEATIPDVARGSHVVLVIRRGLVEVSAEASANIDGDVGDVVPCSLRPSGRIVRARIEDRDHAVAIE